MENKKCTICKETYPSSAEYFYRDRGKKDGYATPCKKCRSKRKKEWYKLNSKKCCEKERKWRDALKKKCVEYKGSKCSVCGYGRCLAALDFHHIDPKEKSFDIGRVGINHYKKWTEALKRELDKCVLICSNCHRELHYWNK